MPYCSQCGVEVDDSVETCPLCQTPIQRLDESGLPRKPYPESVAGSPPVPPLTMGEKMAISRTITTIGFLIPLLFITAIDVFINRRITWSAIVNDALLGTLMVVLMCLFAWRRPYFLTFLIHLVMSAFLLILSFLVESGSWIWQVGLPLSGISFLLVFLCLWVVRRFRRRGPNVAGTILIALALFCGAIDLILVFYYDAQTKMGWSFIAASVLLPTAALLFYIQTPRFAHSRFRRFFHL